MSKQPHPLLIQAIQAFQLGAYTEAKQFFLMLLEVQPKNFDALHVMGVLMGMEGRHADAVNYFLKAIKINSNHNFVFFNLAKALSELDEDEAAIKHHMTAIRLSPKNADAWLNYGRSLAKLTRFSEAIEKYDKALQINPNHVEVLTNKGAALNDLGRYEDALPFFDRAIQINPDHAATWSNKGNALSELRCYQEAFSCYDQAIELNHDYAIAWSNKGETLKELKQYKGAINCLDQAIKLEPNLIEGWLSKAEVFDEIKDYSEALICYEKALAIDPSMKYLYGQYVHAKMNICDWNDFDISIGHCEQKLLAGLKVVSPFISHSLFDRPNLQLMSAKIFASEEKFTPRLKASIRRVQRRQEKIRIAYFSSDFRNHAVSYLISELIELHDRQKFEIYGFSSGPDTDDAAQNRLKIAFDHFIDIRTKGVNEVVQMCDELQIDIAVDLGGYTSLARPELFAQRVAPVQVSYLGFIGTTGNPCMDYIIGDETVIPVGQENNFSEKIIYMPHCYQVSDSKRKVSDRIFTRSELKLPEKGVVFCCFNNSYKIHPATFDSWMRILQRVDGSVLWLIKDNSTVTENLQREAEKRGIDPNRLVFAERVPNKDYLARFKAADLFLDTLPYNAGTIANDALFVGLPVLTLQGQSFVGRMASSLLQAINLPELVASSRTDYEDKAVQLAQSPVLLSEVKNKLNVERHASTLFDTELFARHIESAFENVLGQYEAGLPASTVYVEKLLIS